MTVDPYTLLGVTPDADRDEIHRAFRALARRWHPDVNNDPAAHVRMQEYNAAYDLLRDPTKRAAYDRDNPPTRPSDAARHKPDGPPPPPPFPRAEPAVSRVEVPADAGTRIVQVTVHNDGGPANDVTVLPEQMGTVHLADVALVDNRHLLLTFEVAPETSAPDTVAAFAPPPGAWREAIFWVAFDDQATWVTIAARDRQDIAA